MSNDQKLTFHSYPSGWFAVAFSTDVAAGEVKRLKYFGRELVLFRTESGVACVAGAYCPHMGAHLGVGGRVEGETIRCPFHGWTYSTSGACTGAPCRDTVPRAQLNLLHVAEQNQVILVWYDAAARPPSWLVPVHPEPVAAEFSKKILIRNVRAHVRDVFENIVDMEHFHAVHGTKPLIADEIRIDPAHPQMLTVLASTVTSWRQPDLPDFSMDAALIGPGHGRAVGAAWGFPEYRAYNTFYATPVDEQRIDIRSVCRVLADECDASVIEEISKVADMACENVKLQLQADVVIWRHKKQDGSDRSSPGDKEIATFRKWYRQFYSVAQTT